MLACVHEPVFFGRVVGTNGKLASEQAHLRENWRKEKKKERRGGEGGGGAKGKMSLQG